MGGLGEDVGVPGRGLGLGGGVGVYWSRQCVHVWGWWWHDVVWRDVAVFFVMVILVPMVVWCYGSWQTWSSTYQPL